MAQACTICTHPERHAIERAVVDGQPKRRIAAQFSVKETSLRRHCTDHFPRTLAENAPAELLPIQAAQPADSASAPVARYAEQKAADERVHTIDVLAELVCHLEHVKLLRAAVDAWLRDPDEPSKYFIGPRADDITVIYDDQKDLTPSGRPRRKRALLQDLLDDVERIGRVVPVRSETSYADPRELLLKTSRAVEGLMQLQTTLLKEVYSAQQVAAFQDEVLRAVGEVEPDVRARIESNLRRRLAPSGLPLSPQR